MQGKRREGLTQGSPTTRILSWVGQLQVQEGAKRVDITGFKHLEYTGGDPQETCIEGAPLPSFTTFPSSPCTTFPSFFPLPCPCRGNRVWELSWVLLCQSRSLSWQLRPEQLPAATAASFTGWLMHKQLFKKKLEGI